MNVDYVCVVYEDVEFVEVGECLCDYCVDLCGLCDVDFCDCCVVVECMYFVCGGVECVVE